MSKNIVQADNVTMSAGGLYSLATIGAKDVIDKSIPRVLEAIDNIELQGNEHWNFSDMGCADGGTSLDLWRSVTRHCRQKRQNDIQIVYADQARNDFNALVGILHGLTQFESYLHELPHVHAIESGSSFYQPILPRHSLHLGFSATAMHWLRGAPTNISNHVHMVGAEGDELKAFEQQGREDWAAILLHRARELKPGGRLVLINFCQDEQGRYLGNTGGVNMFNNFNANWQSFLADGTISEQEYQGMTLPQYYNTVDEFSAPLLDKNSDVYKAGLRLESIKTAVVPCPFAEDFKQHGDANKFAKAYIPTIRSWNESVFAGALSADRSQQERSELIEAYYQRYQDQVAENPEGHGMGYVHAYMTIAKEAD
ncbi:MAG: hypothetical protein AB8B84_09300 [Granulosicoccus sp.]